MLKKKPAKEKTAAVLTVHHAALMTPTGRKKVAEWLRQQADSLIDDGKFYAPRFTGRYLYR